MKLLSLSGGATKFAGIVSCAKGIIDSGFTPTHIVGVSAGALATLPIALGIEDLAIEVGKNITLKQIFSSLPVKDNGKLTFGAICRLLIGKKSLGVQKTNELVKSIITEKLFDKYKNGDYPECYVLAVNFSSGGRKLFRIKDLSYEEYISAVSASSHIPMVSQPIEINNEFYFDGGIRDHNPGHYALTKLEIKFEEVASIYSRPAIEDTHDETWKDSFFNIFARTIDIMNIEISKTDEQLEQEFCNRNNIKLNQIFLPKVLNSLFDTDKERLKELAEVSYNLGKNIKLT
jgi:predicted patatin/cPLA2 family phospholipase